MGVVIQFPVREIEPDLELEFDIFTAVDAAIRDLREIARELAGSTLAQAEDCRRMLEAALDKARLLD